MALKKQPTGTTAIIQLPDACPPDYLSGETEKLPDGITKIIVVDLGVDLPSASIITQIEDALEDCAVCQPYSRITYLDGAGKAIGSMSSAAKGRSLNDKRWNNRRHYCQDGIVGLRIDPALKFEITMLPGEITSPVPTPYVPPVIEPAVFVELPPVYAIQDPSELYTDPIRILPEEMANLDTPAKP